MDPLRTTTTGDSVSVKTESAFHMHRAVDTTLTKLSAWSKAGRRLMFRKEASMMFVRSYQRVVEMVKRGERNRARRQAFIRAAVNLSSGTREI
jgi:hypothetical protein